MKNFFINNIIIFSKKTLLFSYSYLFLLFFLLDKMFALPTISDVRILMQYCYQSTLKHLSFYLSILHIICSKQTNLNLNCNSNQQKYKKNRFGDYNSNIESMMVNCSSG